MTVPVAGETMAELPAVLDELAAAGYSDIWTSEVNATDAFAPLLMAAQQAPQLRLGTSIAGVFSRSPALMAMSALAVAELSDEPIYVGVGSSSQNMVEQWHGTPFVQPYQRVRDTVRFLRAAFAGQRVTFHGDSFEIDGFRLARVPPHPPRILVAALRGGMLRLAGKEGDGVVLNWLSPDDTARVVPLVLDGNPAADVVARIFVVTGPDREAARGLARRMVTAYLNTGVYADYQRWLGRGPALEAMWDAWQAGDRRGCAGGGARFGHRRALPDREPGRDTVGSRRLCPGGYHDSRARGARAGSGEHPEAVCGAGTAGRRSQVTMPARPGEQPGTSHPGITRRSGVASPGRTPGYPPRDLPGANHTPPVRPWRHSAHQHRARHDWCLVHGTKEHSHDRRRTADKH